MPGWPQPLPPLHSQNARTTALYHLTAFNQGWDSNPGLPVCQASTLPEELHPKAQIGLIFPYGARDETGLHAGRPLFYHQALPWASLTLK